MGQCTSTHIVDTSNMLQCKKKTKSGKKRGEREGHTHYPEHPPRTDSPLYTKTHHTLCIKNDTPCFICGKTRKQDKIITETHHFFCEYAAMNGINWLEFGKRSKTLYNPQTGENFSELYDWNKVQDDPGIFVDSVHNMVVLCEEHHRSSNKGIHHVPFPEWILQMAPKDGFSFLS